jgi:hypothetical protein
MAALGVLGFWFYFWWNGTVWEVAENLLAFKKDGRARSFADLSSTSIYSGR